MHVLKQLIRVCMLVEDQVFMCEKPVCQIACMSGSYEVPETLKKPISKMQVTYSLDAQDRLTVVAQDLGSGVQNLWQQSKEPPLISPLNCKAAEIAMLPNNQAVALCS